MLTGLFSKHAYSERKYTGMIINSSLTSHYVSVYFTTVRLSILVFVVPAQVLK